MEYKFFYKSIGAVLMKINDNKMVESNLKKGSGALKLLKIASSKKWWLIGSIILSIISTVLKFIPIIIVYLIIDELSAFASNISNLNKDYLFNLGFISLASLGAYGILLYASGMLSHIAAFNILYEIRVKLSEKLTRLSMGFFTQKASGKIKKVLSEDVEEIELFVAHHIPDISSAIVFPVLMIGYLFYMDWRLALAALIPLPLIVLVNLKMMGEKRSYQDYHNSLEKINASVVEYVRGMPVVKVFNAKAESFRSFKESVYSFRNYSQKVSKDYSKIYPGFLTILSSSLIFILPLSAYLLYNAVLYQNILSTVFLFLIVGGGMYFPFFKLMFVGSYMHKITVGVERIYNILSKDEIKEAKIDSKPKNSTIEFKNVSFAYDHVKVVNGVSFVAQQNSITALVGPSGAGKTTIGLLLTRYWDIQSGEIMIGGVNIKDMQIETLMNYISFVFQDEFLFFDTIEENIRMGNKEATKEEVINAAKAAQCHEFIEKLEKGYDTLVGEGGTYLSGGEKQRIGIARVILKNSPIIILDEATAYADAENEGKILKAFSKIIKDKTVIVIAHRLSTITDADQILVIDEGNIIQKGKHQELINDSGIYKTMWEIYSNAREWVIETKGETV